jgi:virulence-associated protein VapD
VFAIAFDLDTNDTRRTHPKSVPQAYTDIRNTLAGFGFEWRQGSVYTCDNENLANLFDAMQALKNLSWFPASVRDIRAFRVEQWSDFTPSVRTPR